MEIKKRFLQITRNLKKQGKPVSILTDGLKPGNEAFKQSIIDEYNRYKPRIKQVGT